MFIVRYSIQRRIRYATLTFKRAPAFHATFLISYTHTKPYDLLLHAVCTLFSLYRFSVITLLPTPVYFMVFGY